MRSKGSDCLRVKVNVVPNYWADLVIRFRWRLRDGVARLLDFRFFSILFDFFGLLINLADINLLMSHTKLQLIITFGIISQFGRSSKGIN